MHNATLLRCAEQGHPLPGRRQDKNVQKQPAIMLTCDSEENLVAVFLLWRSISIIWQSSASTQAAKYKGRVAACARIHFQNWWTWDSKQPSASVVRSINYNICTSLASRTFRLIVKCRSSCVGFQKWLSCSTFSGNRLSFLNEYGKRFHFFWNMMTRRFVKGLCSFHRLLPWTVVHQHILVNWPGDLFFKNDCAWNKTLALYMQHCTVQLDMRLRNTFVIYFSVRRM